MDWRIKGILQCLLSVAPGGYLANGVLQRTVGEMRDFRRYVASKVEDWAVFMSHFRHLGFDLRGRRMLEIGTGWLPILPLCFFLGGIGSVATYDVTRHMSWRPTRRMVLTLDDHVDWIAEQSARSPQEVRTDYERLREATSLDDLLQRARVEYRAPADATRSGYRDAGVDVVLSNSVLEHVPRDTIAEMMRESARVLRPNGLAVHSVNCGDHYAYFDRRISPINYLTFTERQWRRWNNDLLYQNRLRPRDFLEMAEAAGLELAVRVHRTRPDLVDALEKLEVAPEFRHYPVDQLCCTSIDFVARKPSSNGQCERGGA
jgi:SAM-dependent methyltransferase